MPRSESLISLLTTDIAILCAKPEPLGPLQLLLLQSSVPDAEISVFRDDNGNDDDVRYTNLTFLDVAWIVGWGCASALLPFRLAPPFFFSRRRLSLLSRRSMTRQLSARYLSSARFLRQCQ
jgi:hypothetical protein